MTGPKSLDTPYLVLDLRHVRANYDTIASALPRASIRFAVKAAPIPEIIRLLADRGAQFDAASIGEIRLCLASGADPATICYGNPIKKPADIASAHAVGIRRFGFDTAADLARIAEFAPDSHVECRFLVDAPASQTPFGTKFGCDPQQAVELLTRARDLGLQPAGPYFHVGSQQLNPAAWRRGLQQAGAITDALQRNDIAVSSVNLGGGLPVTYTEQAPALSHTAAVITAAAAQYVAEGVALVVEPGRALAATAGVIHAEVVAVRVAPDGRRWVYLDIGRYNGLAETENEAIVYRIATNRDNDPSADAVIAGPTCDGDDVLYQRTRVRLPTTLRAGDPVRILDAGAYTASYSSVSFNGFPPLTVHVIGAERE